MSEDATKPGDEVTVWERLESLSDQELSVLVESALFVLEQGGDSQGPSPATMPPGPTVQALRGLLRERGMDESAAERIVGEAALSRPLAILILGEIAKQPELAREIEEAWRKRKGMMAIGAGVILAAALLVLVLKLKRVKVAGSKEVDVQFDKVSEGALGRILKFLGG